MRARHSFGLPRAPEFGALQPAHREVHILVCRRVGQAKEVVDFTFCAEAAADAVGAEVHGLRGNKFADGIDVGGEGLEVLLRTSR